MGEGMSGIAYAFDVFAERTGDRRFERYALATASYLESLIAHDGGMPWGPGRPRYFVGYLNGAAGDAFMFLRLYQHTRDTRWLADAMRLLAFVDRRALPQRKGLAWPLYTDRWKPGDPAGRLTATGIEEGAAGIGWVELQAWHVTHDPRFLRTATAAGDWLLSVAQRNLGGASWPEDAGVALTHTSLDNGAPGIGWFLDDLTRATGRAVYRAEAARAVDWLASTRRSDGLGTYWFENRDNRGWHLPADPSWHWGTAGIAGFLARMRGWPMDIPGQQPALQG
jgi:hypothetical protein